MSDLRKRLIRLAYQKPELRGDLLPLLKTAGLKLYHLSPNKFSNFKQQFSHVRSGRTPDIGFHFGTKKTAFTAADMLYRKGRISKGDTVYLYEVDLNAGKTLELKENRRGSWSVNDLIREIFEGKGGGPHSFITDEELDDYYEDIVTLPDGENLKDLWYDKKGQIDGFIEWFKAKGFDSIKYNNTFEGGGVSYIALDPNQIKIKKVTPMTFAGEP